MFIDEIKIEETEEGYRIEIKGDKERLRNFLEQMPFGMRMPFGPGFGFGPGPGPGGPGPWRWKGHRRGHWKGGPHGRRFNIFLGGPWGWHEESDEDQGPSPYSV